MIKIRSYNFLLLILLASLAGCNQGSKTMNKRVSLWRKDKIPYGTYVAYENMKYVFPNAYISINTSSPTTFNYNYVASSERSNKRRKAYVVISPRVIPDKFEINALMNFVGDGNQVFISAFYIGDSLLSFLKIKTKDSYDPFDVKDTLGVSVYHPLTYDSLLFKYPGFAIDSYVSSMDSQYTTILGRDMQGRANFVKLGYKGGGAIYLHFVPLAFSNFFLLHKENKAYYDNVFSYLPTSVTEVKWDDYFRYSRRNSFSSLQYIFGNRSLRWAFWLILLLFALIYLFESKRRQKLIPILQPLNNSSLDFVKTIGRLYYQQKDNGNLVAKMITHFLDHVRVKFNLATSVLDDDFVDRLAYKSGYDKTEMKTLMDEIKIYQQNPFCSDEELLNLNKKMEAFYKQA
ncbi:MAG: hypothetical protein JST75_07000 [Bacteroidetes bacterium]|nr:hypothetical protein [Bacteroidota bacterium]